MNGQEAQGEPWPPLYDAHDRRSKGNIRRPAGFILLALTPLLWFVEGIYYGLSVVDTTATWAPAHTVAFVAVALAAPTAGILLWRFTSRRTLAMAVVILAGALAAAVASGHVTWEQTVS